MSCTVEVPFSVMQEALSPGCYDTQSFDGKEDFFSVEEPVFTVFHAVREAWEHEKG